MATNPLIAPDCQLVAYVVPQMMSDADHRTLFGKLRRWLKSELPVYMMPSYFICLDAIPLTHNRKLDRTSLPRPQFDPQHKAGAAEAPQNDLELSMMKLWADALGTDHVSQTTNFFEAGGDSFTAIHILHQIEKTTGRRVDMPTFFEFATPRGISDVLQQEGVAAASWGVVPLRRGGSRPALYCICGVAIYYQLAQYLSPDQPVFGAFVQAELELAERIDRADVDAGLLSVGDMAGAYVDMIHDIHRQGPYRLAGFSFGGLLALEIAAQLEAEGHEVEMMALIDTLHPNALKRRVGKCVWHHLRHTIVNGFAHLTSALRRRTRHRTMHREIRRQAAPREMNRIRQSIFQQSRKSYEHVDHRGRLVFFRAMDRQFAEHLEVKPYLGWRDAVGDRLETHNVPGDHMTILKEPHVRLLAQQLQLYLDGGDPFDHRSGRLFASCTD